MTDSLSFKQNSDGSYEVSWDKDDPDWNFMNDLTSKECECQYSNWHNRTPIILRMLYNTPSIFQPNTYG